MCQHLFILEEDLEGGEKKVEEKKVEEKKVEEKKVEEKKVEEKKEKPIEIKPEKEKPAKETKTNSAPTPSTPKKTETPKTPAPQPAVILIFIFLLIKQILFRQNQRNQQLGFEILLHQKLPLLTLTQQRRLQLSPISSRLILVLQRLLQLFLNHPIKNLHLLN